MAAAEDDLKSHVTDLLIQKQHLEMQLRKELEEPGPSFQHQLLQQQQANLRNEISKLRLEATTGQYGRIADINAQVSLLDSRLQKAELDLAKEMVQRQMKLHTDIKSSQITQLEATTNAIEEEIKILLQKLSEIHLHGCQHKLQDFTTYKEQHQKNSDRKFHHMGHLKSKHLDANTNYENMKLEFGTSVIRQKQVSESINCPHERRLVSNENVTRPTEEKKQHAWDTSKIAMGDSRSSSYYQQQQSAVKAAMDVREELLNGFKYKS